MIEFKNIYKKYGKLEVLHNIDLSIVKSGIFSILGPNGSGKTTLLKCILGMVTPDSGSILINGENIQKKWQYRNELNYLPQIATFPGNLTVTELISMVKNLRIKNASDEMLIGLFGLEPFLEKKLSVLSGGTKQKVNLVLTFMFDSPLIILDEPTIGLDPLSLIKLKELIDAKKKAGNTILITTHIMSFAEEISDEVVFLLDGKKYFMGTIAEIKKNTGEDNLEASIAKILENNA